MKKFFTLKNIILILVVALITFLIPFSVPLIFAFLTAILLGPFVNYLTVKKKLKRIYSVVITFFTFLILITIIFYLLVTVIIKQMILFIKTLPAYISSIDLTKIETLLVKWENYSEGLPREVIDSVEHSINSLQELLGVLTKNVTEVTFALVSSVPTFLFELIIYLIAVFLFLNEFPSIKNKIDTVLPDSTKDKLNILYNELKRVLVGFFKAQIVLSGVTFLITFVALLILDVNYVVVLSLLVVLVDLLPILGTGSFLVPWAVVTFINGQDHLGIGLIILFIVITVVRRIIEPKVYSTSFGISALAALISMYLGFQIMGLTGLIVGPGLVILFDSLQKAGIINIQSLFKKD